MGIHDEFQSQPFITIYYTHNETSEGSSCCEMLERVQTHSILVKKVSVMDLAQYISTDDSKTGCGDHGIDTIKFHSQPCLTIYHTYDETLEGFRLLSIA